MTRLDAAERRGLSLRGRLVLVVLAEALLAVDVWLGVTSASHYALWLVVLPVMLVLGLLVTVQAHHRFPVAWHVVVWFGWAASLTVAPWAASWGDGPGLDTFQGAYVTVLAVYSVVAIELSCLLALARPAGSSYLTVRKVEQAGGS